MTNIIQFPSKNTADIQYLKYGDRPIDGLTIEGQDIDLVVTSEVVAIYTSESYEAFKDRETAAKFFWACAYYLDSEQRYAEDTYVGMNYKD